MITKFKIFEGQSPEDKKKTIEEELNNVAKNNLSYLLDITHSYKEEDICVEINSFYSTLDVIITISTLKSIDKIYDYREEILKKLRSIGIFDIASVIVFTGERHDKINTN